MKAGVNNVNSGIRIKIGGGRRYMVAAGGIKVWQPPKPISQPYNSSNKQQVGRNKRKQAE